MIIVTSLNPVQAQPKRYPGDNRECIRSYSVVIHVNGEMRIPVTARCYMGRSSKASTVYAAVTYHNNSGASGYGVGQAGGYGYDRQSAAISIALESAGVTLSESIAGRGDGMVRDALIALTRALYPSLDLREYENLIVVES